MPNAPPQGRGGGLTSVAISDLDDGVAGEIITWDSLGVATTVPTGTLGQVLTSGGAGAEPTFQAGGGASLPVVDTTSIAEGSADATKEVRFEVDGNSTGVIGVLATAFTTAKTVTFPDAIDTLVGKATTDVLTNKSYDLGGTGNVLTGSVAEFNTALQSDSFAFLGVANTFGAFLNSFAASSMRIPLSATPTMAVDGDFAIDTTVTDFSHGVLKFFDGEEVGVVSMPIAQFTSPVDGEVVTYNATNDEFELAAGGGGGSSQVFKAFAGTGITQGSVKFGAFTSATIFLNTESLAQLTMVNGGTFSRLFVTVGTNSDDGNATIRTRKNSVDANIVVTITASTTGIFSDTSNTDTFASSEKWNYESDTTLGTTGSIAIDGFTMLEAMT